MRSVPMRCVAACILALFTLGCEMVKRQAVCSDLGSTHEALKQAQRVANEPDATPEDLTRAAASVRASARTLDPAAGTPAVDEFKDLLLELADSYERRARGEPLTEFTNPMLVHQRAMALHEWCNG